MFLSLDYLLDDYCILYIVYWLIVWKCHIFVTFYLKKISSVLFYYTVNELVQYNMSFEPKQSDEWGWHPSYLSSSILIIIMVTQKLKTVGIKKTRWNIIDIK